MGEERFSRRFGHRPEEHEIRVREDAPEDVRGAILTIAESDLDLKPSYLREVLCSVLRKLPNRYNWSEYPNVWGECQSLIEDCPWYRVYDFVEALYQHLQKQGNWDQASRWQELINDYFLEAGIGWRMVNGLLESRGPEAFVVAVDTARNTLQETRLPTARQEIHEALRDLSRRPEPDLTGAIHHAMGALECTTREATGDVRATLGEILKRHPDLLPKPIDEAALKLWGYASEMARHLREGRSPLRPEAELLVGTAAALCTYLAEKIGESR